MRKPLLLPWAFCLLLTLQTTLSTNFDNDLTFDEQPPLTGEKSSDTTLTSLYGHVKNTVTRVKRQWFDFFNKEEVSSTTTTQQPETTEHSRTTRDVGDGSRYDEEDNEDINGSGDLGSGSRGPVLHGFGLPTTPRQKKFIDRLIFFIQEFYRDEIEDKTSELYTQLKSSIESGLQRLFETEPVSGTQTAQLVGLASTEESDVVKVTVDIYTQYTQDQDLSDQIKNALEKEFREKSKIGDDVVVKHNDKYALTIRSFGERDINLDLGCPNGILCSDQTCLPIEDRCDGVPQCTDGYDENDCPDRDVKRCRGDDASLCGDKSAYICADQICDGNKDCDDGSDESNCTKNCLQREFMCDVKRCIPSTYRCDGIEHCRDKTDEQNCPKKGKKKG